MMRTAGLVMGMAFLAFSGGDTSHASTMPMGYRAIVLIELTQSGTVVGRLSGVVISPKGDIATTRHGIEDDNGVSHVDVTVIPTGADQKADRNCRWKPEKYTRSTMFDLSILHAPASLPCPLTHVKIGRKLMPTGTTVTVLGYPQGEPTVTITRGSISGMVYSGSTVIAQKTDAAVTYGNSGGAVIDDRGRLIGIVKSATLALVGQGLGLFVPSQRLIPLAAGTRSKKIALSSGATRKQLFTVKTINDPRQKILRTCKEAGAAYDESLGKCLCPSGMLVSKDGERCIPGQAACEEIHPQAVWNPELRACQCAAGYEPDAARKRCIESCEGIYGAGSYRNITGKCACPANHMIDETEGRCITGDTYCGRIDPYAMWNATGQMCVCRPGYIAEPMHRKTCQGSDRSDAPLSARELTITKP